MTGRYGPIGAHFLSPKGWKGIISGRVAPDLLVVELLNGDEQLVSARTVRSWEFFATPLAMHTAHGCESCGHYCTHQAADDDRFVYVCDECAGNWGATRRLVDLDPESLLPLVPGFPRDPDGRDRGNGYVYFIAQGDFLSDGTPVKIGHSGNPVGRLADLQTSHYALLSLIADVAGGPELEAELHERFGASRLRGEWFSSSPALRRLVASLDTKNSRFEKVSA